MCVCVKGIKIEKTAQEDKMLEKQISRETDEREKERDGGGMGGGGR